MRPSMSDTVACDNDTYTEMTGIILHTVPHSSPTMMTVTPYNKFDWEYSSDKADRRCWLQGYPLPSLSLHYITCDVTLEH